MTAPAPAAAGRIGLLVPSSNTTVEPEFYRALPPGVTLHTTRLFLTRIAPDAISALVRELEQASRLLASADVDVIVLGATAPSFLNGIGYDQELIGRIRGATGKPATTTSTAMIAALRHIGARRIALGSAYDETVSAIAAGFLAANGFAPVVVRQLGLVDNLAVGRLAADTACALAREIDRPDVDAIMLACTNWPTMSMIARLERELGKPVLSTSQVSLWAALRMLGAGAALSGWGMLLERIGPVRPAN